MQTVFSRALRGKFESETGRQTGGQSELDLQARRDPVPPGDERRGEPHGPVVERPHQGGQH